METIVKKVGTRRAGLLVMLLLVAAAFLSVPHATYAICCGWENDVVYYSNASKTVVIGECIFNESCTGYTDCWGSTSSYTTRSKSCCDSCIP